MLAAAAGRPYRIAYGGVSQFQYAPDVARAFAQALDRMVQHGYAMDEYGSAHEEHRAGTCDRQGFHEPWREAQDCPAQRAESPRQWARPGVPRQIKS